MRDGTKEIPDEKVRRLAKKIRFFLSQYFKIDPDTIDIEPYYIQGLSQSASFIIFWSLNKKMFDDQPWSYTKGVLEREIDEIMADSGIESALWFGYISVSRAGYEGSVAVSIPPNKIQNIQINPRIKSKGKKSMKKRRNPAGYFSKEQHEFADKLRKEAQKLGGYNTSQSRNDGPSLTFDFEGPDAYDNATKFAFLAEKSKLVKKTKIEDYGDASVVFVSLHDQGEWESDDLVNYRLIKRNPVADKYFIEAIAALAVLIDRPEKADHFSDLVLRALNEEGLWSPRTGVTQKGKDFLRENVDKALKREKQ